MTTVSQEIEEIISMFSTATNKELLKLKLEYLVLIAERKQMKEDHEATLSIIKGK